MVSGEVLGISEGVPGQRFALRDSPVVRTTEHELEVSAGPDEWEVWSEVETFAFSGGNDRHFKLDETDGELVFGPAVREADGSLRHYGGVPPRGATLRIRSYRAGGGERGNVAAGAISVLKTPIAFVSDEVRNRMPATGGRDVEDVESVKQRGPLVLRTRNRAVTASDYETLVREATPEIARVKCVPAGTAGTVRVLVVPSFGDDERGRVDKHSLVPSEKVRERITAYLDERRPVGVQVLVEPPRYQAVTIAARLRARAGRDKEGVRRAALDALYRYCHPASGGPDGGGWPFGRSVRAGEIHGLLLGVAGVDVVDDVRLFRANPETGERGNPLQRIDLDQLTLAYSFEHSVRVDES
jgi:predicted phage baseplate assembly protein